MSNQYLDLTPEIAELAAASGMEARVFDIPSNNAQGEYRATWVLVTDDAKFFLHPDIAASALPIRRKPGLHAWTDDYSSLSADPPVAAARQSVRR